MNMKDLTTIKLMLLDYVAVMVVATSPQHHYIHWNSTNPLFTKGQALFLCQKMK